MDKGGWHCVGAPAGCLADPEWGFVTREKKTRKGLENGPNSLSWKRLGLSSQGIFHPSALHPTTHATYVSVSEGLGGVGVPLSVLPKSTAPPDILARQRGMNGGGGGGEFSASFLGLLAPSP